MYSLESKLFLLNLLMAIHATPPLDSGVVWQCSGTPCWLCTVCPVGSPALQCSFCRELWMSCKLYELTASCHGLCLESATPCSSLPFSPTPKFSSREERVGAAINTQPLFLISSSELLPILSPLFNAAECSSGEGNSEEQQAPLLLESRDSGKSLC